MLLTALAAAVGTLVVAVYAVTWWRTRRSRGMRDSGLLFFMRSVPRIKHAALEAAEQFGEVHLEWLGLEPMVTVSDPETAKVLLNDTEGVVKHFPMAKDAVIAPISVAGMNNVNGDQWRRQRSVISPALLHDTLRSFYDTAFSHCTRRALEVFDVERKRSPDGVVDATPLLRAFTLDVLGLAGFGRNFNSLDVLQGADTPGSTPESRERVRKLAEAYELYMLESVRPLRLAVPFLDRNNLLESTRPLEGAVKTLQEYLVGIVDERRAGLKEREARGEKGLPERPDFVDCLVSSPGAADLSSLELTCNAMLLYVAGADTTQIALQWALIQLADHPEVQRRARAEVDEVLDDGRLPTFDDLRRLPYVLNVAQESMRLEPPACVLPTRQCRRDVECPNGVRLQSGTIVNISIAAVHRNEKHWPDAARFDPDRFSPEGRKGRHPYAFLPFSLGRRVCAGRNFSLAEQQLFLAAMLQRYEIVKPEGAPTQAEGVPLKVSNFFLNTPLETPLRLVPRTDGPAARPSSS